jgi:hypothetical protein
LAAIHRGWLIYANRIVDAEGGLVATAASASAELSPTGGAPELQDVLKVLSTDRQKALCSYWLMVGPNGACQQSDSMKKIYGTMKRVSAEFDENLSGSLAVIYPDGLPKFDTWRKTFTRIEEQLADQPELLDVLRQIGLLRRPFGGSR